MSTSLAVKPLEIRFPGETEKQRLKIYQICLKKQTLIMKRKRNQGPAYNKQQVKRSTYTDGNSLAT